MIFYSSLHASSIWFEHIQQQRRSPIISLFLLQTFYSWCSWFTWYVMPLSPCVSALIDRKYGNSSKWSWNWHWTAQKNQNKLLCILWLKCVKLTWSDENNNNWFFFGVMGKKRLQICFCWRILRSGNTVHSVIRCSAVEFSFRIQKQWNC